MIIWDINQLKKLSDFWLSALIIFELIYGCTVTSAFIILYFSSILPLPWWFFIIGTIGLVIHMYGSYELLTFKKKAQEQGKIGTWF